MRLHEACHTIEHILARVVRQEHRVVALDWLRSGYDLESGAYLGHTPAQDAEIRCVDCGESECAGCAVHESRKQHD